MTTSRTDEVMRLTDIIVKADSRWSGLQETRNALRSAVQAMEDELAAAKQGETSTHEFRSRLTEFGLAMRWGQSEKAKVLADVLASMVTHPAPVQEGWLMVPVEPTPTTEVRRLAILKSAKDLLDARQEWDSARIERLSEKECRRTSEELTAANKAFDAAIDAAMLAASPAAPSTGEPK